MWLENSTHFSVNLNLCPNLNPENTVKKQEPGDSKWPGLIPETEMEVTISALKRPRLWVQTRSRLEEPGPWFFSLFFWFLGAPQLLSILRVYFMSHYLWIPSRSHKDFTGLCFHPQKTIEKWSWEGGFSSAQDDGMLFLESKSEFSKKSFKQEM